jgi:hypothetical protein
MLALTFYTSSARTSRNPAARGPYIKSLACPGNPKFQIPKKWVPYGQVLDASYILKEIVQCVNVLKIPKISILVSGI